MIHGQGATTDCEGMGKRPGEPRLGLPDRGRKVLSKPEASRDGSRQGAPRAMKATGDHFGNRELGDLPFVQQQVGTPGRTLEVATLD